MVDEVEVLKAIQKIVQRGENPTYDSILETTRGSKREIAKVLIPWREAKREEIRKKIRPLVDRFKNLDFMEQREFLLQTDLMEITPTERRRREGVGQSKKRK